MTALTRQEQYLEAISTGVKTELPKPLTRVEQYLYQIAMNGGGGGGGHIDYEDITDKPTINGVELSGDMTLEDIGVNPISETQLNALLALI